MKTFKPVRKPHNNRVFTAPVGMGNCKDLYVTKIDPDEHVSTWTVNLWERIKFLFHGEISLSVIGGMPPVSISTGDSCKELTQEK